MNDDIRDVMSLDPGCRRGWARRRFTDRDIVVRALAEGRRSTMRRV